MTEPSMTDRIIAELRQRRVVPYDELEASLVPTRPGESPYTRTLRRRAFVRSVSRARHILHSEGWTINRTIIGPDRYRFALELREMPT